MRPEIRTLLCALIALQAASYVTAYIDLAPDSFGKKAHQIESSDEFRTKLEAELRSSANSGSAERILEATKVIQGEEGCRWSHFTSLLDLLKSERKYPAPLLIKISIAKQLDSCGNKVTDLPENDGLDSEEKGRLTKLRHRISHEDLHFAKTLAKACLSFLKEDQQVIFKGLKKSALDERVLFRSIFFKEMNFCFTIDHKLRHYYEFVDQIGSPTLDLAKDMPVIVDRLELGLVCRAFVNNNQKVEEIAFKKTMGRWYNFKKSFDDN